MKSLFVLSNASGYGGAEKSIEVFISHLSNRYNITIFVENHTHIEELKSIKKEKQASYEIVSLSEGKGILTTIKNCFQIYKQCREYRPEYILANTNKAGFYLAILSYLGITNNKIFLYIRDFQWKYLEFILEKLQKAYILIPSGAVLEKEEYLFELVREKKVFAVADPCSERTELNGIGKCKYILCLANLSKWKGINYLVSSYEKCKAYDKKIPMIICGNIMDIYYYGEIQGMIRDKKLQDNIKILPFQSNVANLYNDALFVVNSSISEYGGPETFGRTIIEAWSYKKPVISFQCGGPKYIIENGIDGFLVEEKNICQFAEVMNILIDDDLLRKKMGEAGYEKVCKEFSAKNITEKLVDIFEN